MNIVCEKVGKSFGSVVALEEVSLTVERGEIRALLGGNGSGKSTLVKILAGVVAPSKGKVQLFERSYQIHNPKEAKRAGVIMTSQELSLLDNLSVAENIALCMLPNRFGLADQKRMRELSMQVLSELGMEGLIDHPVSSLAPNEKYMVEYAKALVQNPKILLVDEITSALFKEDVAKIKKSLKKLKEHGCSVLFISHRMGEIFDICDSVTVMRNGRTVASMKAESCKESELLTLMTGRSITQEAEDSIVAVEEGNRLTALSVRGMHLPGFGNYVDLDVKQGEIVGIAGLQGHGQSELVRKLFGLSHAVNVTFNGREITYHSPIEAIQHGIAFISGDREKEGVFREQSVSENLNVVRQIVLKGRNGRTDTDLLREYGVVYDSLQQKLTELSGGNQQKVVIGRWISAAPKLLLADDPTKGIDVNARSDVHKLMHDLTEKGAAILMFSSDDGELVRLTRHAACASVVVMYEGKIVKRLRGAEITEENISKATLQFSGEDIGA